MRSSLRETRPRANDMLDPVLSLHRTAMRREQLLWLAVAFEGGLFVLAAVAAWLFGLPLRQMATWDWPQVGWSVAATVPPLVALWWMQHSSWGPLRRFRETVDRLVTPLFEDCTWLDFAAISLVAGVGEE